MHVCINYSLMVTSDEKLDESLGMRLTVMYTHTHTRTHMHILVRVECIQKTLYTWECIISL